MHQIDWLIGPLDPHFLKSQFAVAVKPVLCSSLINVTDVTEVCRCVKVLGFKREMRK